MIPESENPAAGGTASGVESKADKASMQEYPNGLAPATLRRLRAAHVAAVCGVSDHRAAMIAAFIFAEVAQ